MKRWQKRMRSQFQNELLGGRPASSNYSKRTVLKGLHKSGCYAPFIAISITSQKVAELVSEVSKKLSNLFLDIKKICVLSVEGHLTEVKPTFASKLENLHPVPLD